MRILFWPWFVLLAWTHVLYPPFAELLARVPSAPSGGADIGPMVAIIVTAYSATERRA